MIISFWFRKTPAAVRSSNPDYRFRTARARGFSLVEISIALGVFAFAIISVFGLLGIALDTSRESQRDSTLASIIRTLDADMRFATTTNSTLTNSTNYFDLVGKPLTSATNASYRVTLTAYKVSLTTNTSGEAIFKTNSTSKLNLWSAVVAYPSPSFPLKTTVLLGNPNY